MHPILFKLGPLSLFSYGLMVALGFLVGIGFALYFARKEGIKSESIIDLALLLIVSSIIGARFFYVAGQWNFYRGNLLEIFMIWRGGLVFLGGLIFGLATLVYFASEKKIALRRLLDVVTPGALLGYAIGRIGCFLNGCCFGLPTKLPWGIVFPNDCLAGAYFPDRHLHPTQLYSVALVLIAFGIVLWLYPRKKFDGQVFFWGLILYSIYRLAVEFLRYSPIHWLSLTPSQWIALAILAVGIGGLLKKWPAK